MKKDTCVTCGLETQFQPGRHAVNVFILSPEANHVEWICANPTCGVKNRTFLGPAAVPVVVHQIGLQALFQVEAGANLVAEARTRRDLLLGMRALPELPEQTLTALMDAIERLRSGDE